MNKKMLIICAGFALIISCKNYAIKDLEQKTKGQVNGFLDKILDPTKDEITSSSTIKDELAKKLQEEEKKVNDGEREENKQVVNLGEEGKEQEVEANKVEEKKIELGDKGDKTEEQGGKEKDIKVERVEEQEKEELAKAEEKKEIKEEVKAKVATKTKEEAKVMVKKEIKIEEDEDEKVKKQIRTLTDKIDEINKDIGNIKDQTVVKSQEVKDKITGSIYDYFTNNEQKAIYYTWGEEGDLVSQENEGLGKLLKELSDVRSELRTKLNVGNESNTGVKNDPELKESVNVSEIIENLEKVKLGLEKVKEYLENQFNFETIKEYITDSNDDYE
ncbi:ErpC protein [Borreliella carolinensis]|uniref:ErpC protein n=1 Tax=Borreliella carolinensis TaxID=478174 RepID=UPI003AF15CA2